jgi:ABC-2 type transport system ATP-binding protein
MSGVLREAADARVPVVFSSHQLDLVERLCDRVGIISAGRMVAVGTVEELRSGGVERIDVVGPQGADWASGLHGVSVVSSAGGRTRVQLENGASDQEVLHAALAAGPVHEFARCRPPLTELYRDVVTAGGAS